MANKIAWRAKPQSWRYRGTIGLRALVESLQIGRPIPNLFQEQFPHHAPKQMLLFWLVENRRQGRWLAGGGRVAKRCGGWMVGGLWVGGAGSRSSHREAPCHTQRPSPASGWASLAHSWRQCHPNSDLVREDQVSSWSRREKRGMRWKILWCRIQVMAMWTRPKWRIQFPARK